MQPSGGRQHAIEIEENRGELGTSDLHVTAPIMQPTSPYRRAPAPRLVANPPAAALAVDGQSERLGRRPELAVRKSGELEVVEVASAATRSREEAMVTVVLLRTTFDTAGEPRRTCFVVDVGSEHDLDASRLPGASLGFRELGQRPLPSGSVDKPVRCRVLPGDRRRRVRSRRWSPRESGWAQKPVRPAPASSVASQPS